MRVPGKSKPGKGNVFIVYLSHIVSDSGGEKTITDAFKKRYGWCETDTIYGWRCAEKQLCMPLKIPKKLGDE